MISNWSIGGIWVGPLLILLLCTLFTLSNQAATRQVPADFPTIQQALDASSDGDSVVVAAGIWFGSLDFGGRDLVLLGSGTSTCILQGLAGRLLVFSRGESSAARLEGFTLRQGQAPTGASNAGGAILIRDSSPTLRGNRFELCSARQGGAVALIRSSSLLEGNEFDTNQAFMGGAVYVMGGAPELRSNRFLHNTGGLRGYGGALSLESTAARVRQNLFVENGAFLGGAISCRLSPEALIERNTIAGNEARMGGGLYLAAGDPLVQGNLVAWSAQGEAAASALMASPMLGCNLHFDNAGGDGFPGQNQGGNRVLDPLCCDPQAGDYRLQPGSPCYSADCGILGFTDENCQGTDILPHEITIAGCDLRIAPNPFNGRTWLSITGDPGRDWRLELYSITGRKLGELASSRTGHARDMALDPTHRINGHALAAGVYFLRLTHARGELCRKVVYLP